MNALQENDMLVHVLLREVGRYDAQQLRRLVDYGRSGGVGLEDLLLTSHKTKANKILNCCSSPSV